MQYLNLLIFWCGKFSLRNKLDVMTQPRDHDRHIGGASPLASPLKLLQKMVRVSPKIIQSL